MPPLWFELWIFRLPGKGGLLPKTQITRKRWVIPLDPDYQEKVGYSTRPLGTTSSLIIWVDIYVASVTISGKFYNARQTKKR